MNKKFHSFLIKLILFFVAMRVILFVLSEAPEITMQDIISFTLLILSIIVWYTYKRKFIYAYLFCTTVFVGAILLTQVNALIDSNVWWYIAAKFISIIITLSIAYYWYFLQPICLLIRIKRKNITNRLSTPIKGTGGTREKASRAP